MRRFAFLAAATRISAFEFHPEVAYQLRGEHLVITAVAEHYAMEMFSSFATNKTLLPVENWRGLLRDVIDWIAREAGFTFELRSASGDDEAAIVMQEVGRGRRRSMPQTTYAPRRTCLTSMELTLTILTSMKYPRSMARGIDLWMVTL